MASASNILNMPLQNLKANLKILFNNSIDIKTTDRNILNKYTIYKFY